MNLQRLKSLLLALARTFYALPLKMIKLLTDALRRLIQRDPASRKNLYAVLAVLGVVATARYLTNSAARRRKVALAK